MSDNADGSADPQITFKVKTSGDRLHTITMAESATVHELKSLLATADYEDIPVERQRLIYSGRVMKNDDTLGSYKIKAGNTLHLVKSAASNHPPTGSSSAAAAGSGTAGSGSSAVPPAIPANMAAGTPASNLLAGLTGARFAGHAALPNQDIFGPDGGMNLPSEDHIAEMMNNPAVAQSVNEALNNPSFVDFLIENNPSLRNTPNARELIQSPFFRSMLTNPESLRMMNRMRRAMTGQGAAFPAPGATDNTPADAPSSPGAGGAGAGANPFGGFNPFMFGFPGATGAGAGAGTGADGNAAANPFLAFFPPNFQAPGAAAGGAAAGAGTEGGATPSGGEARTGGAAGSTGTPAARAGAAGQDAGAGAAAANPFSFLFGPGGTGAAPQGFPQVTPEMMQQAMQMLGGAGSGNPFMPGSPPPPPDNRPPEERYAEQLRQLNDMGFFDFDRNVAALRRSGGSVQGAIQHLLGD